MKQDIHPEYHAILATCTCGAQIPVGSTLASINVEICSQCHPFFTGTQKLVDSEGRVQKFEKRYGAAAAGRNK